MKVLLKGIINMVEIALFFSFLISSVLGFCVAHYLIIPILECYFRKQREEFLEKLFNKMYSNRKKDDN